MNFADRRIPMVEHVPQARRVRSRVTIFPFLREQKHGIIFGALPVVNPARSANIYAFDVPSFPLLRAGARHSAPPGKAVSFNRG